MDLNDCGSSIWSEYKYWTRDLIMVTSCSHINWMPTLDIDITDDTIPTTTSQPKDSTAQHSRP